MEFRGYRPEDLDALYALDVACFAAAFRFSRALMKRFAEAKKARVVIAEENGLAGFNIIHVERWGGEKVGYVMTLDVAPAWRRQGLAAELMQRGETLAVASGCESMALHVAVENEAAIRFYERVGYERLGRDIGFYGDAGDAWVYRKVIRAPAT